MKKTNIYLLISFFLTFMVLEQGFGQYPLEVIIDNESPSWMEVSIQESNMQHSTGVEKKLHDLIQLARLMGHLTASVDSLVFIDSAYVAQIHLGTRYKSVSISSHELDAWLREKMQGRIATFEGQYWTQGEFSLLMNEIVTELENTGYPFGQVYLDSIKVDEENISGVLKVNKNSRIVYDSISNSGDLRLSNSFLENYLKFKPGSLYKHDLVKQIPKKLEGLSYLEASTQPEIRFYGDKAVLNLDLKEIGSSRFDFLIGVLPKSVNGVQKISLALDLTLEMRNKLSYGEYVFLRFQRLKPENQELDIRFNYPYLLDLPFGTELGLHIYRNSKDYLDVDFDIGWQYLTRGTNYLKLSWNLSSSRLLDIDKESLLVSKKLPTKLDYRYSAGGLEVFMNNLDYPFNPIRGYSFRGKITAGARTIIKNLEIEDLNNEEVDFSTSYDSLNLQTYNFRFAADVSYFIPLGLRATWLNTIKFALQVSEEEVFENELYRIGGNQILRGFDEKSILSKSYYVYTSEFRLLISRNSYLSAFTDFAIVENPFIDQSRSYPFAIGAGLSFETKAGIFGIDFALGKTNEIPFNFRNAKVHFGFLSLF